MPTDPPTAISDRWSVSDIATGCVLRRKRRHLFTPLASALGLVVLLAAIGSLAWVWFHPPSSFDPIITRIGIGFMGVMGFFGLLASVRGDITTLTLSKDKIRIQRKGVLGVSSQLIDAKELLFAYGEQDHLLHNDDQASQIVLGMRDSHAPLQIEVHDAKDRQFIADKIRDFYRLPEYPVSHSAHASEVRCLQCRYDLQGLAIELGCKCPECGKELESWQVLDFQAWHNQPLQLPGDARE